MKNSKQPYSSKKNIKRTIQKSTELLQLSIKDIILKFIEKLKAAFQRAQSRGYSQRKSFKPMEDKQTIWPSIRSEDRVKELTERIGGKSW